MISEEEKQRIHEHKRKMAYETGFNLAFKGKKHSDETKKKMSKKLSTIMSGNRNHMFGKIWIKNPLTKESKIYPKDIPIPEGWVAGRICKK